MSVKDCLRELDFFHSLARRKLRGVFPLSSPTSWEVIGEIEPDASQAATREVLLRYWENIFHREDGQTLERVAQRGCRPSIFGGIQYSAGQRPEQLAVTSRLALLCAEGWTKCPPEATSD